MISSSVDQRIRAVIREIQLHKTGFVASIVLISLIMLAIGLTIPKNYESSALLYADLTSTVSELMQDVKAGQIDHAEIAKEIIGTRRFMDQVVKNAGMIDQGLSKISYERELSEIRSNINVRSKGRNYMEISYQDETPEESFAIVNAAVEVFIKESATSKRSESRKAFEFIQNQVNAYKKQLDDADNRLKDFLASSRDGTQETTTARITDLRSKIEQLQLDIDEAKIKHSTLTRELNAEGKYVKRANQSDEMRKRLAAAQQRLDSLLLSFTETHPDVLALRDQIADMERAIDRGDTSSVALSTTSRASDKGALNPLYEDLRKQRAEVSVKIQTSEKRLRASENLLEQEYQRQERIVGRGAERSELTRDYDTMNTIYETLLNRLENARMTMTLDVEGQGGAYRIQEPPTFPLLPIGLRFLHFLVLGPLLALLIPAVLIYAYVELDPRIRMASVIQEQLRVPVLAVVPHVTTNVRQSIFRSDLFPHFLALAIVLAIYVAVALYKLANV